MIEPFLLVKELINDRGFFLSEKMCYQVFTKHSKESFIISLQH